MDNYYKIYWLTRLDALNNVFGSFIFASLIVIILYYMLLLVGSDMRDDEEQKTFKKDYGWLKNVSLPFLIIGILGATFIPTKNEAILILAGGKTMNYIQSDTSLSKLPYQTTQIISEYLDEKLNDLKEEKSK